MTQVAQAMTRDVRSIRPDDSLVKAAQTMEEMDTGVLPVVDGEELVGVLTDRDIVVRGVAQECQIDETVVADVMTEDTVCCFEDQDIDEVQEMMKDSQIRRVPVVDRDKHLVGILSLADLATRNTQAQRDKGKVGDTLGAISQPGEKGGQKGGQKGSQQTTSMTDDEDET